VTRPAAYVALLRGINVGGTRKLPMAELAEVVASLGHGEVNTFIQTGNVLFTSRVARARLAKPLERAIDERFGLDVTIMIRSPAELQEVATANPFPAAEATPNRLHVVFLERKPSREDVDALDPDRSPGDRAVVDGDHVYLHLPNGAGRTKLTLDYLERVLRVRGTQRNWNTLVKLIELSAPEAAG
jgi:uncharacterized protein (DUF1697 family)